MHQAGIKAIGHHLVASNKLLTVDTISLSLHYSGSLPSAGRTRQSPLYTRQRLCRVPHSAKSTRQRIRRQRILCRVPPVGHSAKPLPSAMSALGKVNVHRHLPVSLPSADVAGTRQRVFNFFKKIIFAECRSDRHSAK